MYRIILNMDKGKVIKRFNELLKELGMNPKQLSDSLGKDRPQWAYDILNENKNVGISKNIAELVCEKFPQINKSWLLTGEGKMLLANNNPQKGDILSQAGPIPTDATYKLVPVIHIDSVGGMHSNNDLVGEPQYLEGYVPFVNAKDDDKAIYQSGDSMIPTIPPGSLMQIREVKNWREYFGYGNIFVIELSDGRRITKEVSRYEENPKGYVWCISHNPNVPDEELPKSMIVSVWKVIKVLTDKGW